MKCSEFDIQETVSEGGAAAPNPVVKNANFDKPVAGAGRLPGGLMQTAREGR